MIVWPSSATALPTSVQNILAIEVSTPHGPPFAASIAAL